MQVCVQGQQINVGDALRTHVTEKLEDITQKYFNRAVGADVTFNREGHAFIKVHISIRIGKDILVMASDTETEAYAAFDIAAARVAKQLRRYKKKLRDHHERISETPEDEMLKARDYILASSGPSGNDISETGNEDSGAEDGKDPVVVAEMTTSIPTLTVSDAVMRMDLAGLPAMMFRNASHGGINMVYRRSDNNVGWVDPVIAEQAGNSRKTA